MDLPAVDDANQAPVWKQEMSSLARIPPGQSLVVGGLLEGNNEGDNLVMVITPTYTLPEGISLHPEPATRVPLLLSPRPRFVPQTP